MKWSLSQGIVFLVPLRNCWQCIQPLHRWPPTFLTGTLGGWWSTIWLTSASWFIKISTWPWFHCMVSSKGWIKGEVGLHLCLISSTSDYCWAVTFGVTRSCCMQFPVCGHWISHSFQHKDPAGVRIWHELALDLADVVVTYNTSNHCNATGG